MFEIDKDSLRSDIKQVVKNVVESALAPELAIEEADTNVSDIGSEDMNLGKKKESDDKEKDCEDDKEKDDSDDKSKESGENAESK
jgi:hypothetical protein